MWDSIPGRWNHDLSRRQLLNQLSHPGVPLLRILKPSVSCQSGPCRAVPQGSAGLIEPGPGRSQHGLCPQPTGLRSLRGH